MYQYFVNYIRGLVLEHQCKIRNEPLPDWYQRSKSAQSGSSPQCAPPSTPPDELFQGTTLYRSWDDNGIPMTDAENQPITKSAQKRMRKAQAAHKVKYLKYLRDPTCASSSSSSKADESTEKSDSEQPPPLAKQQEANWTNAVDPSFVNIVAGTFGKRQSLEFFADMGPFCHVIQV